MQEKRDAMNPKKKTLNETILAEKQLIFFQIWKILLPILYLDVKLVILSTIYFKNKQKVVQLKIKY